MWLTLFALLGPALAAGTSSAPPPAAPAVDFAALPPSASARGPESNGKPHPVLARLLADSDAVAPGATVRVGVHLTQDEGWHTYWRSPGDIGQPTDVVWHPADGVTVTPIAYPVPQRFEVPDVGVSYGYERQVLLISSLTVPKGTAPGPHLLAADATWLVCMTSCIPGSAHLEVPVVVGPATTPSKYAPLFDHYAAQLPVAPDTLDVRFVLSQSAVHPNDTFQAAFVVKPKAGKLGPVDPASPWPSFTPIAGADFGVTGVSVKTQADGSLLATIAGLAYEPDPLPTSPQSVGGLVQVQVDGKWVRTEISGPLPWVAAGVPVQTVDDPALQPIDAPTVVAPPPVAVAAVAPVAPMGGTSLLVNLALAFVGGLILNVMPCVLPVLTLKMYGLVEHAEISAAQRRATGLAYTGGVIASFWALAAMVVLARTAFGMQVDWGFQFQYPGYVAALATVVFAFGLSLLGVFEIPVVGAEAAEDASSREGLAGSFMTGVFATLLATPCSAPFLGTAIAYAFSAPTLVLVAIFTLVGAGLAAPFLLVAFMPALYRYLPRPGEWMDTLKQLLGFSLLATTIWLVDVLMMQIGGDRAVWFLVFLLSVGLGCWVYGRFGGVAASRQRQLATAGLGLVIALFGGWRFLDLELSDEDCDDGTVASELSFQEGIPWQPFSEPRLAALDGKTVFVDFTAEWCGTCKFNERTILETELVRATMKDLGVVPLKADWTRPSDLIHSWLQTHGRAGVPMYLVIPGDRTAAPILLPEVITPQMVVDALHSAS